MINRQFLPFYLIGLYPLALTLGTLISELITFSLIVIFIIHCVVDRKIHFDRDPIIYFLFFIWLYLLLNLLISIDFQLSLNRSIFFIRYPLLLLSICYFINKYSENLEIIFKLWIVTLIILIIDLYIQFFFGENLLGFKSPNPERLSGFFNQELKVAHLLIGFFLPAFGFFLQKNQKNYPLYFILFLYFVILILTNERANILRGVFALVIFSILIPHFKFKFKIIFSTMALGIFALILIFVKPINQRFIYEIGALDRSIKDKHLWNYVIMSNYGPHYLASIEVFKSNKYFGTGVKTFRKACKDISLKKFYPENDNRNIMKCSTHPHQYYFEFLSDLGLIGFLILLSFFFYLFVRVVNSYYLFKNLVFLTSGIFIFVQLIPLLPTGSFFTSFGSTIFFINLSLFYTFIKKK